ncbi:MAG: hypothetical protein M1526_07165 [Candidatus Thermoplasmatota archaeon]|nr:hypothetical protein [Candidatus Thermoplasmatota archaeon]
METALLIHVWIPFKRKGMERKEQSRIYRMLYGYNSSSKYGKYHYTRKGLLDTIPSIRYEDGNFMIPARKKNKVINFLEENNASYRLWRVIPGQDELEKLKTN